MIQLLIIPFIFSLFTATTAMDLGRNFWTWFWVSLPLPVVAQVILLSLPERMAKKKEPVENDDLFKHLF